MQPYQYKSWLRRQVELGMVIMLAIVLLPSIVLILTALLRPMLVVIALVIVLLVAMRGAAGYVEQRRGRW